MISRLRSECGDQFTQKVEGMVTDLGVSEAFMQEYRKVRGDQNSPIETHFYVLSQASWPISTQEKVSLPPMLTSIYTDFEKYYLSRE